MEWSEECTLLFISEYKNRPVLWDLCNRLHFHKVKRNDAWDEVAAIVGRPTKELKKKGDSLMASFRRERAKLSQVETGKDTRGVYSGSWYAFKALRFVIGKNKPISTLNTIEENARQADHGVDDAINDEVLEDDILESNADNPLPVITLPQVIDVSAGRSTPESGESQALGKKSSIPKNYKMTAKQRRIEEEKRLNSAYEILQKVSAPKSDEDDSDIFGKLVSTKLKRFDSYTRSCIENKIMEIFLNAERDILRNGNFQPQTMSRNVMNPTFSNNDSSNTNSSLQEECTTPPSRTHSTTLSDYSTPGTNYSSSFYPINYLEDQFNQGDGSMQG